MVFFFLYVTWKGHFTGKSKIAIKESALTLIFWHILKFVQFAE